MRIARVFCHFKVPATRGHRDEDDRHAGQPFVNDNEASCAAAIEANHLDLMEKEQEAESVRSPGRCSRDPAARLGARI